MGALRGALSTTWAVHDAWVAADVASGDRLLVVLAMGWGAGLVRGVVAVAEHALSLTCTHLCRSARAGGDDLGVDVVAVARHVATNEVAATAGHVGLQGVNMDRAVWHALCGNRTWRRGLRRGLAGDRLPPREPREVGELGLHIQHGGRERHREARWL